jgi:hypothetical protein
MKIQKITVGFVIQTYDTDAQCWTDQNFTAGECTYEVEGDEINESDFTDRAGGIKPYLPFSMMQPGDNGFGRQY